MFSNYTKARTDNLLDLPPVTVPKRPRKVKVKKHFVVKRRTDPGEYTNSPTAEDEINGRGQEADR